MDVADDFVVVRVGDGAVLEILLDIPSESGLEGWLTTVRPGPRRHRDTGMGRMGSTEGAGEELGAKHVQVGIYWEDLGLCVKVVGV